MVTCIIIIINTKRIKRKRRKRFWERTRSVTIIIIRGRHLGRDLNPAF
jgi:hypothetical protein